MPIGFAGRGTAGRLSGGGTAPGLLRVGLGAGVASPAVDGSASPADSVGSASAEGVADADAASADGDGLAEMVGVGAGEAVEKLGADGAGPVTEGGEPDGVVVQPAMTPAHTRALRAITVLLTSSG